jgi:hypothetical protein
MDMSKFQSFGKNISSSFSPFAARTGQFMREQLGQAEDKVHSPSTTTAPDSQDAAASGHISSTPSTSDTNPSSKKTSGPSKYLTAPLGLASLVNQSSLVHKIRRKLTEEKTQLPPDYIELEKRVDALKQVHQKLLAVT